VRKLIFSTNITIDGFIDHTAVVADDELHERAAELIRNADLVLYGRIAYQLMADYWPIATQDPSLSKSVRVFAETINRAEKVVFSKTLTQAAWKTRILREVDPEQIREMKRQPGKDLLLGPGAKIAQAFMRLDLIDEYQFLIQPVILGRGIRLFPDAEKRVPLTLVRRHALRSGVMELTYRPVRPG
jgi:dihydrofolate reductase